MSNIQSRTYENAAAVTVSDTVADPAGPFAGLIVTATGTLKFTTIGGGTITLSTNAVGTIYNIAVQRVWSTGTSATVMGLYAPPYKTPINPGSGTVLP